MLEIGDFHLYWYGIIISLSTIIALFFTFINTKIRRENFSIPLNIILYAIPICIVFSRLFYVALNYNRFKDDPLLIFHLTNGGLSIYGAFLGLLLIIYFYTKKYRLDFWYWLDILIPGLIFGLMMVQVSNFCLQNSIGVPFPANADNRSLTEYIVYSHRPVGFESYLYFFPVALYQALALGGIFIFSLILTFLKIKFNLLKTGNIFIFSMILAALTRFVGGFFYLSTKDNILHGEQYLALFGIVLLLFIYIYGKRKAS